jgi:alpha-glucosidase
VTGTPAAAWWRDAVLHEVYVRSFADGTGDGVGDLAGVRQRLAYLAELGVDGLWLTPFYVSPMADHGYDVADPRDVDPLFGDLATFDGLLADAHSLGLRVLVDLVPNHSSDRHPWFAAAVAAGPGSPERARYLFRDGVDGGPPNGWQSTFGGPAWTQVPDGQWYLHLFAPEQPDLNWRHPEVRADYERTIRFWLDRGVDGFRIDVAHGLVKDEGLRDNPPVEGEPAFDASAQPYIWDHDEVHEVYRAWRAITDEYEAADGRPRAFVAEAWVEPQRLARYVRPDELHLAFAFSLLLAPWSAAAWRAEIEEALAGTAEHGATATWVLGNHDVVRPVTRYGGGPAGLARARAAALTLLALPGTVFLYQGDELGLPQAEVPP